MRSLKFSKYSYKDTIQFGEGVYYGVIAEEVAELLPSIVSSTLRFVPDIYRKASITLHDSGYDGINSTCIKLQFDG
jgi:hypothetical protein